MKHLKYSPHHKWWILTAMGCALSMIFVDQTAPAMALPQMQHRLNLTSSMLQWVVNAYLLALSTTIVLGGKLADLYGARRMFLSGLVLFALSSALCGLGDNGWWIIMSRVFQGIGGALMIPASSPIILQAFEDGERGRAIGIYVGVSAIFLSLGPLLGGALTHILTWRWVYWINLPIAITGFTLGMAVIPEDFAQHNLQVKIDWWGFLTLAIFLISLVLALMQGVSIGWDSPVITTLFILSFIAFCLFILLESKVANPLINLRVFQEMRFTYAVIILLLLQISGICLVFWAIFLQNVMGMSAWRAGMAILPSTIPVIFMAPLGGRLRDTFGAKVPITLGLLMVSVGALIIAWFASSREYWLLFPGFLLSGSGIPFVIAGCTTTALSAVDRKVQGVSAGLVSGIRQLGTTLGLAIIGSVIANTNKYQLTIFLQQVNGRLHHIHEWQIDGLLARSPSARHLLRQLPPQLALDLHSAAIHAYTVAFSSGMYVAAAVVTIGLWFTYKLPGKN